MKQHLIFLLRDTAKKGNTVCDLVHLIQDEFKPEKVNTFLVIYYFMHAFNLSLNTVREISGAECLGGGIHKPRN